MGREEWNIKMVRSTQVNGKTIKSIIIYKKETARAYMFIIIRVNMMVNGLMTNLTDMENLNTVQV